MPGPRTPGCRSTQEAVGRVRWLAAGSRRLSASAGAGGAVGGLLGGGQGTISKPGKLPLGQASSRARLTASHGPAIPVAVGHPGPIRPRWYSRSHSAPVPTGPCPGGPPGAFHRRACADAPRAPAGLPAPRCVGTRPGYVPSGPRRTHRARHTPRPWGSAGSLPHHAWLATARPGLPPRCSRRAPGARGTPEHPGAAPRLSVPRVRGTSCTDGCRSRGGDGWHRDGTGGLCPGGKSLSGCIPGQPAVTGTALAAGCGSPCGARCLVEGLWGLPRVPIP